MKQFADIRREYLKNGLSLEQLDTNPIVQFQQWLDIALEADLLIDPTAMTLSTVDEHGCPSSRIVLLKKIIDEQLVFFTNLASNKAKQIQQNPSVCLQFAWLPLERQIIIHGQAKKLSSQENANYFFSRPRDSQLAAWASAQSQPIASRADLDTLFTQTQQRFADKKIPLPDFWGGYQVQALKVEFWQGGGKRLHDRFVYEQQEGQWQINRLQP